MIIRTAASEGEVQQALDVYFVADPPVTLNHKASTLAHWLAMYSNCPEGFWIAEEEELQKIVGVASAVCLPPQWILTNFYVRPEYQGNGIGRKLLYRAFSTWEGCERFLVHASEHASAISLYMQFGMYPLPYSIFFTGNPDRPATSSVLTVEDCPIDEILLTLGALDQKILGFTRPVYHQHWATYGSYYLVKKDDEVVAYFRVSSEGLIGPLVTSHERWMVAVLDQAIDQQKAISPGKHEVFIPGANRAAIAHLLALGYRYVGFNLLLSSHPMPGLANVIFHDTDLL